MKNLIKVKLMVVGILFIAIFVMNGRIATKSNGNITLSQLAIANADWGEYFYPCGNVYYCRWDYALQQCEYFGGGSMCYCYCGS